MRYLTADYVFPISQPPIKNGVVVVDEEGKIVAVLHSSLVPRPSSPEHFNGILCPGFVNTHCHLELSHMKGAIPEKTGLAGFINGFIAARKTFSPQQIENGIAAAEKEMLENGIVAVGDICNVSDTFRQKAKGNLKYYNFIEGFDFFPENTDAELERIISVISELEKIIPGSDYSVVPHAPYSVSENFLKSLTPGPSQPHPPFGHLLQKEKGSGKEFNGEGSRVLSMHNQESADENLMFREKRGRILAFFESLGMDFSHWKASGKSSLQTVLNYLPKENNVLLVHNTFTDADDIRFAEAYSKNIYWVTCPNANLYIENRLPDYNLFRKANAKMTIGTDSLASNHSLSVLDELKTISAHFPGLKLETLLQWATLTGAEALGFRNELGSFEAGKKPGVVLIENLELENLKLTATSSVRRLV